MSNGRIILGKRFLGSSIKIMKVFFFTLLTILLLFQSAWAGTAIIRLAWNPNGESDLAGYRIYFGTSPRTGDDPKVCGTCGYSTMVDVGNVTTYRIPGLIQGQTYYISATAYDTSNNESVFSDEVSGPAKEVYINFDGDGKTDVSVYKTASGIWFIKPSSGEADYYVTYGGSSYLPVSGDYDRDGKTDIAVYHPSSGIWYIKKSSDGTSYSVGYGGPAFAPVPGDYDGDGKNDVAVYHQAAGLWYIMNSSTYGTWHVSFGGSDYVPVPGDYDGDGKTDMAIYHQASGLWYIMNSSTYGIWHVSFGGSDYVPVPGDYDGDGKTDISVYHSTSGVWFIKKSSDGTEYYVGYGGSGYIPINLDYLLGWVY